MRDSLKQYWGTLIFVFYCTAVGVYLLLRPWAPDAGGASPFVKGFVSGLGIVHLIVGAADFAAFYRRLSR